MNILHLLLFHPTFSQPNGHKHQMNSRSYFSLLQMFFFFFSDGSRDLIYMMEMHSVKIAQFLFPLYFSASPHCCQAVGFCHEIWNRIVEGVSNCTNEILTMTITNHSWYRDTPLEQLCQWHEPKIKSEQSLTIFTVQPLASPLQL